jgi:hypothetical protein
MQLTTDAIEFIQAGKNDVFKFVFLHGLVDL